MKKYQHFLITIIGALALIAESSATEYIVSPTGNDKNTGTNLQSPFATISHAISKMKAGDICTIRGGIYQESINLTGKAGTDRNPLILRSYKGEKVTLSGAKKITTKWVLDKDKVYKTTIPHDITQLFVNGKLMTLARFPNAKPFSEKVWGRYTSRREKSRESTNGQVIDGPSKEAGLTAMDGSLNNCVALLNFGAHATGSRLVENHQKGSDRFDYSPQLFKYKTTRSFFFEGGVGNAERVLLDTEEEWAYDETNKTLYFWPADGKNPTGSSINGKVQTYAIQGDASTKNIVIDGLNFIATTFSFQSSDHITIQNCNFDYYASSKRSLGILGPSATAQFIGTEKDLCSNITVYNNVFKYADASGLAAVYVENFLIENNLFSNIDYACVNNDIGQKTPFTPSSTLRMDKVADLVYRRNTLSKCGNAQGFSANRIFYAQEGKRFKADDYNPNLVRPITCEYNFHTACGLLHTDGSSLYIPEASTMESVARFNWFIGNGQRDLRWDGANRQLNGVKGNLYRNVAVGLKIKRLAPAGGNGYRLKGSYHEVYNNLGLNRGGELNVAEEKGGNEHTVTHNNAASTFTSDPIPGTNSHNFKGSKKGPQLAIMLRDVNNWDFRPRSDAKALIDKGIPVTCTIKEQTIDITEGFKGSAPDLGAYEYGDDHYWIPGRQEAHASMPIPLDKGQAVNLDADLMYLIGLKGAAARIYLGNSPDKMLLVATKPNPQNIVNLSGKFALKPNTKYFWRVDTGLKDKTVIKGKVWSFTTGAK